jgi:hypothetical protein
VCALLKTCNQLKVMKGQLPWSVEGLRGQGIELFSRSEAFFSGLHHHLSFLDHVHEFDPDQGALSCIKRFEPQHPRFKGLWHHMLNFPVSPIVSMTYGNTVRC